ALRDAFDRVIAERTAHRATVLGPAGIGKSRLARELALGAREHARVLTGSCPPYGEGVAFRPLAEIVREGAGEEDARAWIEAALGEDQRERLVARSEGNPLFVEQMLALLRESDGGAEPVAIPPTIEALLAARLDRLSVDELHAIGAASVVGREFWADAVAALSPAGESVRLDAALESLGRKQLVGRERVAVTGEPG